MNKSDKVMILHDKGKDWSEIGNTIIQTFLDWLEVSNMGEMEFVTRVNNDTFSIEYRHEPDKTEIRFLDKSGSIGMTFLWDSESGIPFEHYKTDAGLLLLHIRSICHNARSIKTINDFLYKTIYSN